MSSFRQHFERSSLCVQIFITSSMTPQSMTATVNLSQRDFTRKQARQQTNKKSNTILEGERYQILFLFINDNASIRGI